MLPGNIVCPYTKIFDIHYCIENFISNNNRKDADSDKTRPDIGKLMPTEWLGWQICILLYWA